MLNSTSPKHFFLLKNHSRTSTSISLALLHYFSLSDLAVSIPETEIFNYLTTGECDKDCFECNVTEHLSVGSVDTETSFPLGDVLFATEKSHLPFSCCLAAAMPAKENTGNGEKARKASSILQREDPGRPWRRSERHRCDFDSLSAFPGETNLD